MYEGATCRTDEGYVFSLLSPPVQLSSCSGIAQENILHYPHTPYSSSLIADIDSVRQFQQEHPYSSHEANCGYSMVQQSSAPSHAVTYSTPLTNFVDAHNISQLDNRQRPFPDYDPAYSKFGMQGQCGDDFKFDAAGPNLADNQRQTLLGYDTTISDGKRDSGRNSCACNSNSCKSPHLSKRNAVGGLDVLTDFGQAEQDRAISDWTNKAKERHACNPLTADVLRQKDCRASDGLYIAAADSDKNQLCRAKTDGQNHQTLPLGSVRLSPPMLNVSPIYDSYGSDSYDNIHYNGNDNENLDQGGTDPFPPFTCSSYDNNPSTWNEVDRMRAAQQLYYANVVEYNYHESRFGAASQQCHDESEASMNQSAYGQKHQNRGGRLANTSRGSNPPIRINNHTTGRVHSDSSFGSSEQASGRLVALVAEHRVTSPRGRHSEASVVGALQLLPPPMCRFADIGSPPSMCPVPAVCLSGEASDTAEYNVIDHRPVPSMHNYHMSCQHSFKEDLLLTTGTMEVCHSQNSPDLQLSLHVDRQQASPAANDLVCLANESAPSFWHAGNLAGDTNAKQKLKSADTTFFLSDQNQHPRGPAPGSRVYSDHSTENESFSYRLLHKTVGKSFIDTNHLPHSQLIPTTYPPIKNSITSLEPSHNMHDKVSSADMFCMSACTSASLDISASLYDFHSDSATPVCADSVPLKQGSGFAGVARASHAINDSLPAVHASPLLGAVPRESTCRSDEIKSTANRCNSTASPSMPEHCNAASEVTAPKVADEMLLAEFGKRPLKRRTISAPLDRNNEPVGEDQMRNNTRTNPVMMLSERGQTANCIIDDDTVDSQFQFQNTPAGYLSTATQGTLSCHQCPTDQNVVGGMPEFVRHANEISESCASQSAVCKSQSVNSDGVMNGSFVGRHTAELSAISTMSPKTSASLLPPSRSDLCLPTYSTASLQLLADVDSSFPEGSGVLNSSNYCGKRDRWGVPKPKEAPTFAFKSGFPGVSWNRRMNAWLAFWKEEDKRHSKTFSAKVSGFEGARSEAVLFLLNKRKEISWKQDARQFLPSSDDCFDDGNMLLHNSIMSYCYE